MILTPSALICSAATLFSGALGLWAGSKALAATYRAKRGRRVARQRSSERRAQDALRWSKLGSGYELTINTEGADATA